MANKTHADLVLDALKAFQLVHHRPARPMETKAMTGLRHVDNPMFALEKQGKISLRKGADRRMIVTIIDRKPPSKKMIEIARNTTVWTEEMINQKKAMNTNTTRVSRKERIKRGVEATVQKVLEHGQIGFRSLTDIAYASHRHRGDMIRAERVG